MACVGPLLSYVLAAENWSLRDIGIATALPTLSAVLAGPAWGRLDDAWGGRAARLGLVTSAAAAVLVTGAILAGQRGAVWVSLVGFGAASGALEALLATAALRQGATADRLGAVRAGGSLGWIVGLVVAAAVVAWGPSPALVPLVAAVATLTAPRPRGLTPPERRRPEAVRPGADLASSRRRARWEVLWVLSVVLPLPVTMSTLVYFTTGFARDELGAGPFLAVAPLAVSAALELPAFAAVDRVARWRRPGWMVTAAFPLLGVAALVLGLVPTRVTVLAVQPLVAAGFAAWFVGQSRLVAERVPAHQLAYAQTLTSSAGRAAAGILAGVVGGGIAAAYGYRALFLALAALCLLGGVRALTVPRDGALAATGEPR